MSSRDYDRETERDVYSYDDLVTKTPRAWLLRFGDDDIWLPKSQCDLYEHSREVDVPNWLAEEKGLC